MESCGCSLPCRYWRSLAEVQIRTCLLKHNLSLLRYSSGTRWECFPLLSKKEEVRRRKAQHHRSVNINTSKEVTCFSVFPIPGHFPNYIHNSQLLEYLRLYAKHLDLVKYICFQVNFRIFCHLDPWGSDESNCHLSPEMDT